MLILKQLYDVDGTAGLSLLLDFFIHTVKSKVVIRR